MRRENIKQNLRFKRRLIYLENLQMEVYFTFRIILFYTLHHSILYLTNPKKNYYLTTWWCLIRFPGLVNISSSISTRQAASATTEREEIWDWDGEGRERDRGIERKKGKYPKIEIQDLIREMISWKFHEVLLLWNFIRARSLINCLFRFDGLFCFVVFLLIGFSGTGRVGEAMRSLLD